MRREVIQDSKLDVEHEHSKKKATAKVIDGAHDKGEYVFDRLVEH